MSYIVDLASVSSTDRSTVGGKASGLGELVRSGLPVPPGFVITTEAYHLFASVPTLAQVIDAGLASIDSNRPETVDEASRRIRDAFERTEFPEALRKEITRAYEAYVKNHHVRFSAVRSSATAEDLEGASFAGLQDTYLNITGTDSVLTMIRRCWSSVFTPRVMVYRVKKGFDHAEVRLAVLVQKMVDATVSGVLFTRDPNTGENHMIIEAGWGLGEAIVGGEVTPDHYVIDGASQEIVKKQLSEQRVRIVRAEGGGNRHEDVPAKERSAQKLSDERIRSLASLARRIESHYRRPMDVEWCADHHGLYIVQARPVTTIPAGPLTVGSSSRATSPQDMPAPRLPVPPDRPLPPPRKSRSCVDSV